MADHEGDDRVEVEIRNEKGDVIRSYYASPDEVRAFPKLMNAREKLREGDPMGAFEMLVDVCHQTNTNVFQVIDHAKQQYEEEQRKQQEAERAAEEARSSFLTLQGKDNILHDAYFDGSSELCRHCHALIQRDRYAIHLSYWCPALHPYDSDEDADESSQIEE